MDKEIQSQLYDPKKRRSAWLNFIMQHKHIKLPNGRINLKAISKLWKSRNKAYDPHRLIETKKEGGREVPESHDHYHKNIKIYDPSWVSVKDPFGNPNVKHTWKKGNLYLRLMHLPYAGWLLRLDNWDGITDTVIKEISVGKLEGKAVKKAIEWQKLYDPAPVKHGINRPPKRWFYAMLKGIEKRSDVRNPAAIVGSIWKRLSPSKRAEIKRREATGKPFKYDLPLPDDRATHGVGTLRMVKPFKLAEVQVNVSLKDYLAALKSGLFQKMKRGDGSTALVARCKSDKKNCNIFVDKMDVKK